MTLIFKISINLKLKFLWFTYFHWFCFNFSKRRKLNPEGVLKIQTSNELLQITPLERHNNYISISNQTSNLDMLDTKLNFRTTYSKSSTETIPKDTNDEYYRLYIINQVDFCDYKQCNLNKDNVKSLYTHQLYFFVFT